MGVLAAGILVTSAPTPALAGLTGAARIQTWTANLHMLTHDGSQTAWKRFVERAAGHRLVPDVMALTEVCNVDSGGGPRVDAREVVRYLEKVTGARYAWRHSGTGRGPCWAEDTMVVWRAHRFSFGGRLVRWRSEGETLGDGDNWCSPREGPSSRQLAVVLHDRLQGRKLVVASVHFPVGGTRRCINENVDRMDRALEALRGHRRLTIVGGDFNQTPQIDRPTTGDEFVAGTQVDPECWYRSLSMTTTGDRGQCTGRARSTFGHYRSRSDDYVDVVQVRNRGPAPGSTAPSICDEWTRSKSFATRGTSCTDVSGRAGEPDGHVDRGRIDYLWARWELGDGDPRSFSDEEAGEIIGPAAADKPSARYSDHRAVRAVVSWCLPGERCRH